jgi:hypothetical protein
MLDLAPGICRQLGNRPGGKFLAAARRDVFTVRFTVKLECIPPIDVDRSRRTFSIRDHNLATPFDRSRSTLKEAESFRLNHQRLLQAVDLLGQPVEPRWFSRQMYRHFEWDPLAQLSPSIDIYREQSARPRWPAFEIYRGLSILRTRSLTRKQTICHLEERSRRRRHQTR